MKNTAISFCLIALVWAGINASPARAADPVLWETFENWQVFLSTTDAGEFDLCMATRTYKNEEMLVFYSNIDKAALGLFIVDWQLDNRTSYPVHLQFDDGPLIKTTAVADETKKSVLFDLNLDTHILELTTAATLKLHTGAGALSYDLTGAEEAIKSSAICTLNNAPPGSIEQ